MLTLCVPCLGFGLSSCFRGGEPTRTVPDVGLVWRCLAMSSVCLHAKISTIKSTSCRWVWQDWLSNCSRYVCGCPVDRLCLSHGSRSVYADLPSFLQGHEVQLNHRAVLMTEELILPSLSGLPIKLGINMTSLVSLRLKGNVNYRDASHFSLTGHIKPTYAFIIHFSHGYELDIWLQHV